jgi:hypothetical protein
MDSAANRDPTWHPRDFEAQMLVELLRLSRVTLLYGAQGAGKTTLLKRGVLPLLRSSFEVRNLAQGDKPRIVMPFRGRHGGTVERGGEITIVFDRWSNTPLTDLQEQILDMLPIGSPPMATVMPTLTDILAAWNEEIGVRFFVILDSFEQHLRVPLDRAGIAEFDDEFVRMANEPLLAAHFLLSVRDDAEALLNRYGERISGFGDAFLRLPELHPVTAPSLPTGAQTHRSAAAATPSIAETLTTRSSDPLFVLPAALTASTSPAGAAFSSARPIGAPFAQDVSATAAQILPQEHPLHSSGAGQPVIDDTTINGLETSDAVPRLTTRPELRRAARSPARISLAAIVAGFAIGAGAGYFAIYGYQEISTSPTASIAEGVVPATTHTATTETADLSTVQVPPAPHADHLVPPASSERTSAVPSSAPPPSSPKPIKSVKTASPTPKVASRIAPQQAVRVATAAIDWPTAMRRELDACHHESFFARVVCTEKVRWKHCAPDHWNAIPECAVANIQLTRSD